MNKLEKEFREIKHPSGLMRVKSLRLSIVDKVLMVTKDKSREGGSLEIMSIFFYCPDNGKEFLIIDLVSSFGFEKGLREE